MLTLTDLLATEPSIALATEPDTDPDDTATATTEHYPMPPSPKAEPFIPAPTLPATANTPRDRAYTLHLQGYRSPAIAAHLGVPQRTTRHWIQMTNQEINELPALADLTVTPDSTNSDQPATATTPTATTPTASIPAPLTTLQHQRTLAVERHRARSAAAWALHDQLRATLDPFLARLSERLLLHTQYPDDADHVSMSTLALAGGPLSPAFRAMYHMMYHMLPGLIGGLTRSLALAERADLQIDRLLGLPLAASSASSASSASASVTPTPTAKPATAPKTPSKQPTQQQETKPWPTREEINRAMQAERDAEDAIAASIFTERQLNIFRALACLPDKLPDGPIETWDIKIDPNAPISAWRLALLPHQSTRDPDDPTSGKRGNHPGPGGKVRHASNRRDARRDAPINSGNDSGNKIGNHSGNDSGNPTAAHHPAPASPHSSPHRGTSRRPQAPNRLPATGRGFNRRQLRQRIGNHPGNTIGNPAR